MLTLAHSSSFENPKHDFISLSANIEIVSFILHDEAALHISIQSNSGITFASLLSSEHTEPSHLKHS